MERFNPFANSNVNDDPDPFTTTFNRSIQPTVLATSTTAANKDTTTTTTTANTANQRQPVTRSDSTSNRYAALASSLSSNSPAQRTAPPTLSHSPARYSTSFPDPFGDLVDSNDETSRIKESTKDDDGDVKMESLLQSGASQSSVPPPPPPPPPPPLRSPPQGILSNSKSNSVTFSPTASHSVDIPNSVASPTRASRRNDQSSGSGFSSFLSRATSVTSSSVTDRVSGAVGSVKNAVDSLSNQLQQAVPTSFNERISSTATNLINTSGSVTDQLQQQQQSAASYLASKLSSATGQFTSSVGRENSTQSIPIIRQRVILILDNISNIDWAQQFANYNKLMSGGGIVGGGQPTVSTTQLNAITSFFSSQFSSSSTATAAACAVSNEGGTLIEQADFKNISVLANQSSSTATIYVYNPPTTISSNSFINRSSSSMVSSITQSRNQSNITLSSISDVAKIIRPEYVVVRQRTKELKSLDHLRGIVNALNYCLVPMFEPIEIWNIFQDRQLIFSKLLKVQKSLGKENFPLIPQIYCQTYQDLLNYISTTSSITLPCLACTGSLGKGKIKIDNLQMLKDFASIIATSGLSCTLEQYLDVKCDLIVQKLGTSLKLFKKSAQTNSRGLMTEGSESNIVQDLNKQDQQQQQQQPQSSRPSAIRQTSLGAGVLSSLIPGSGQQQQQQQQVSRRNSSDVNAYERIIELNNRYRNWVEAIAREFDNKIEAFCIKIVVASNDREYIVGLRDCSMEFLGSPENQEEDKRSFVELLISNMNIVLPKNHLSRESSTTLAYNGVGGGSIRRTSSEDRGSSNSGFVSKQQFDTSYSAVNSPLRDKSRFNGQNQTDLSSIYNKQQQQAREFQEDGYNIGRSSQQRGSGNPGGTFGQLTSRSQSVSMNQSDFLNDQQNTSKSVYNTRRGSERSDSFKTDLGDDLSYTSGAGKNDSQTILSSNSNSSGLHQRQSSLGQSFFDQTSTAFNSFQKQSMSFFKRLDASRSGDVSNTPPQSAKSDKGFDRNFATPISQGDNLTSGTSGNINSGAIIGGNSRNGFKSQSIDSSTLDRSATSRGSLRKSRESPPKPPPPQTISYRQSSLASYSSPNQLNRTSSGSNSTPNTTPNPTRQNSSANPEHQNQTHRGKVIRQNSALSAFEAFELESQQQQQAKTIDDVDQEQQVVGSGSSISDRQTTTTQANPTSNEKTQKILETVKKGNFDSASITSGDSNSTGETATAEDTMNNLKKTFASIFGDKCE